MLKLKIPNDRIYYLLPFGNQICQCHSANELGCLYSDSEVRTSDHVRRQIQPFCNISCRLFQTDQKKTFVSVFLGVPKPVFPFKSKRKSTQSKKKAIRLIISRNQNMNEMQIKCKSNNLSFQATLNSHSVIQIRHTFEYIIWLILFNNNVRFMTHCCKSKVLEKKYILKTRLV